MKEYNNIDYTYTELLILDTKIGILDSFRALDIKVSKSLKKAELAEMLATVFEENPFYIINRLSKEDQNLLSQLVACKQDEYVLVSKRPDCSRRQAAAPSLVTRMMIQHSFNL